MKKIVIVLAALVFFTTAALTALAQSGGVLILTEDQQKQISQVQDRATNRRLKVQADSGSGALSHALTLSAAINDGIKNKDFGKAADAWWKGKEVGVPEFLAARRNDKRAQAHEAAQDAVSLIQSTVQRAAQAPRPLAPNASLAGEATDQIAGDMRAVENEKQELDADLREHIERLSVAFPELRHVLRQSGLTSANVRELVIGRLREANQLLYEASIAETNRLIWENVPRIIRARHANDGKPDTIVTQNATEVIKAVAREKVFQ